MYPGDIFDLRVQWAFAAKRAMTRLFVIALLNSSRRERLMGIARAKMDSGWALARAPRLAE